MYGCMGIVLLDIVEEDREDGGEGGEGGRSEGEGKGMDGEDRDGDRWIRRRRRK